MPVGVCSPSGGSTDAEEGGPICLPLMKKRNERPRDWAGTVVSEWDGEGKKIISERGEFRLICHSMHLGPGGGGESRHGQKDSAKTSQGWA